MKIPAALLCLCLFFHCSDTVFAAAATHAPIVNPARIVKSSDAQAAKSYSLCGARRIFARFGFATTP
ncbi:MAG: hypothetical protein ACREHF_09665 [Rhizomicrobium sp.]